ncbi:hypothetical protein RYA05_03320 [Pseudomonas syringae pv. actinidiae]|nr:hypothetical protein [Pseudomonas syringae pv. actinidiae]
MRNNDLPPTPKSAMISCGIKLATIVVAIYALIYTIPIMGNAFMMYVRLAQQVTEFWRFSFAIPLFVLMWGHCVVFKLELSSCQSFKYKLCIANAVIWFNTVLLFALYILTLDKLPGIAYQYWLETVIGIGLFFSMSFVIGDTWEQAKALYDFRKANRAKKKETA